MGMFSWDCNGCGFSLRDCKGCSQDNWMSRGVCLTPDGSRVIGFYDSYGHLGEYNLVNQIGKFAIWHHACWELAGKPEYDKPARHSHDQGFCHAMHGTPLPKPTSPEWFHTAQMWQAIDRILMKWGDVRAEWDHKEVQDKFALFTKEGQDRLCAEYKADRAARRARNRAADDAYYNDPDENAQAPVKEEDPATFLYECITFDYGWLGVVVSKHTGEW